MGVVKDNNRMDSRTVTRVSVLKGVMSMYVEEREATTYIVHNPDTVARHVVLEHPAAGSCSTR